MANTAAAAAAGETPGVGVPEDGPPTVAAGGGATAPGDGPGAGAPSAQIETVSFGEEKPRAQGQTEQAFAENRRADIVYQGE